MPFDEAYWFGANRISSKLARDIPGTATTSFNLKTTSILDIKSIIYCLLSLME